MKLLLFLKRKSGLTPEQFRDYYERTHAPLAIRLLPFFTGYRRNYVRHDAKHRVHPTAERDCAIGYDVVTELSFASRDDYDRMLAALRDPAIASQIAEDEEKFQDRAATRSFFVDAIDTPSTCLREAREPGRR